MSFSDQISAFAKKANMQTDDAIRGITISIFNSVILRTPVDTGRLRSNWFVSLGKPYKGTTDLEEKSGATALSRVTATISRAKGDQKMILSNNLPYASAIENGHGADNPPGGMVKATVNSFKRNVKRFKSIR